MNCGNASENAAGVKSRYQVTLDLEPEQFSMKVLEKRFSAMHCSIGGGLQDSSFYRHEPSMGDLVTKWDN